MYTEAGTQPTPLRTAMNNAKHYFAPVYMAPRPNRRRSQATSIPSMGPALDCIAITLLGVLTLAACAL